MKRAVVLIYGLAAYLGGVAALAYLVAFLFDLYVPKTIDSGQLGNVPAAVAINLGLIALFGLQHSVMARQGFKSRLTSIFAPAAERSTFLLGTAAAILILCWLWQPLPQVIWQATGSLSDALLGAGLAGWGLVLAASFFLNHFDLFGLRQVWLYFAGRPYTPLSFKVVWLYRYVRHPILTGVLIGVWLTPLMTAGHLLFALAMSAYVLIGVWYEERDLIRTHGESYRRYMRATGRFIPALGRTT